MLIYIVIFSILIYCILKERDEMGCKQEFTISQHCNDMNNKFVHPTIYNEHDSQLVIRDKIRKTWDYNDDAAFWRKSYILSFGLTCLSYLICGVNDVNSEQNFGIMMITSTAILYFYHNFMNNHVYRQLKKNGNMLLERLK
jgi:hypothetical protein